LMQDGAFRRGEIDIQFLDRRGDLLTPGPLSDGIGDLALAAALVEDEARQRRLPLITADAGSIGAWLRQARSEGLR
ncbi:MAG TPA: hypothetical protein VE399_07615, partial [Gemmatimonadales bacterium]|nr:hypothetical protein [Gemmatimonadales bacterium]